MQAYKYQVVIETLKSWTIQLIIIGLTAFGFTLLAAKALPMV